MKKLLCAILALLMAAMLCACYPLRVAKNPNAGEQSANASELPDETEPAETEPAETEPAETEEVTEAPTEAANETEEVTEAPTEAATEGANDTDEPTEGATQKPTEAAGTPTPKPTGTESATPTPKATPTPTPKPTATPTPKPTATPTAAPTATPKPQSDFADFSSQSINGYPAFSNATFGNSGLTMVNFWATWCGPCIEELPYLQRLSGAYAGRLQIITVLFDSQTDGAVDTALGIINGMGFTLPVIRCNSSLKKAFTAHDSLAALPTTFFVDRNGHIVSIVKGGHNYEQWCAVINNLL